MSFLGSSLFDMLISLVVILVFSFLISYENQSLKSIYYSRNSYESSEKIAIVGALNLVISFVNIFVSILRLFGERRRD